LITGKFSDPGQLSDPSKQLSDRVLAIQQRRQAIR
jgi:hypothetical protein